MTYFDKLQRHRKATLFIALALTLAGIALAWQMPVSLFPDITFPRIVILADNGEQPANRMMIEVTKPIEENISSVPGIKLIRSLTSRGSSEISVYLDWGTNIVQALELLRGQIASISSTLPAKAHIDAQQMNVSVFPIEGFSLTSEKLNQAELRDIAMYKIRPALLRIPGVSRIEVTGGDIREFQVIVQPEKLLLYHLDIRQVSDAIVHANIVQSTGLVENNYQLYLTLVDGLLHNTDEIASVVVASPNGVPIRVGDLADVRPGVQEQLIRTTAHGRPAVLINVLKQPNASTVEIGDGVMATIATLSLPKDVHFENFYDQAGYISDSIASTRDAILIGVGLAMLVLILFLRNWRITLVVAIVVPATIACTLMCLSAIGESINIMTLGGIAAAVGLIIDDAIVIIESIFAHIEEAQKAGNKFAFAHAAGASLKEIFPAMVGSTASTIVIHIPLGFLSGIAGAFFRSLSITMVFAMLLSFAFSVTIAPLLGGMILRTKEVDLEVKREEKDGWFTRAYSRMLLFLLRHRWTAIPIGVGLLALAYVFYNQVGTGFMPEMDEGSFVLDYNSPPGTSLTETDRELSGVERILMSIPEVESYSRRTGTQLGFFITEPNRGDYLIKLRYGKRRPIDDIVAEVRGKVEQSAPQLRVDFGQMLQDMIGDLTNSPAPIELKLFGANTKEIRAFADTVLNVIRDVPGVVDAFNGVVVSGSSMVVRVDPARASAFGLTTSDVQDQLQTMMEGKAESSVEMPEKVIAIRTRFPTSYKRDLDSIQSITLLAPNNVLVPLRTIATITRTTGEAELDREGLRQYLAVTARISGRDLGSTIKDIQKKLARTVHIPKDVTLEYGGVYQTEQESFRNLVVVALIAISLVFLVLLIEFKEFRAPIVILLITCFSLVGVFGALLISGATLNISSLVGVIMMIGIVAENAIFILHYVHLPSYAAMGVERALLESCKVRIRPIAMTTLAAILALLPLAVGLGSGAQMQQPLAIAVIGGFSVSSIMLFILLPMLYALFHSGRVHQDGLEHNGTAMKV